MEDTTSLQGQQAALAQLHARPPGAVKIFVGQLPRVATEEQIRAIFEEFGPVHEVVVIREKGTGLAKGCAFVIYNSRTEADRAIQALNNIRAVPPMENPLQVKYADGEAERLEHKIFVGMLPKTAIETELIELFMPFGQVTECVILRDATGSSKGCGFVKMENKQQAVTAIAALQGQAKFPGSTVPLTVKFADSDKDRAIKRQTPDAIAAMGATFMQQAMNPGLGYMTLPMPSTSTSSGSGPPGANLFVFHLPNTMTDLDLTNLFSPFGRVLSVKVFRDKNTGEPKGFGFVSYDNAASAHMAIAVMSGYEVGGKRLKVEIKKPGNTAGPASSAMDAAAAAAQAAANVQAWNQNQLGMSQAANLLSLQNNINANSLLTSQLQQGLNAPGLQNLQSIQNIGLGPYANLQNLGLQNLLSQSIPTSFPGSLGGSVGGSLGSSLGAANVQAANLQANLQAANLQANLQGGLGAFGGLNLNLLGGLGNPYGIPTMAPKKEESAPVSGPAGANLFVFHLPSSFTDQDMLNAFSPFGKILSVKVFYDKATGEQRGFGFVSYESPAAAQAAIAAMNGLTIAGKRLKVQLKKGEDAASKPY